MLHNVISVPGLRQVCKAIPRKNILCSLWSMKTYSTSNDDDNILTDFVNRNPRNMEMLRLARKPIGYCLDTPTVNFWYRLQFEATNKFLHAYIEHHSGRRVVEASTKELCFQNQLYSMKDISAAMNLGIVLANRSLKAGINEVQTNLTKRTETSKRVTAFLKSLENQGLVLEEPPQLREKEFYQSVRQVPACPWEVLEEDVDQLDSNNLKPLPDRYFAPKKQR